MKKIIIPILMVVLFSLILVTSQESNVGVYDEETLTMEIVANGGAGSTLAYITLDSPLEYNVMAGEERLVAWYTINNLEENSGSDVFGVIETLDLKRGNSQITKNFKYKLQNIDTVQVPNYVENCSDVWSEANQTMQNECVMVQDGTKDKEVIEWGAFNKNNVLPVGTYTIGLFTEVEPGERVEWIPNIYDVAIPQWAVWNESFSLNLETYYPLNDTSDSVNGLYNLSIFGSPVFITDGCLIGGCINISSNNNLFLNESDFWKLEEANRTVNFWFRIGIDYGSNSHSIYTTGISPYYEIFNYGTRASFNGWPFTNTNNQFSNYEWMMISFVSNDTSTMYYLNGTLKQNILRTGFSSNGMGVRFGGWINGDFGQDGTLDETSYWSRALSNSEIQDLWNDGDGLTYIPPAPPDTNPPYFTTIPANSSYDYLQSIALDFEATDDEGNFNNFYVDNALFTINQSGHLQNAVTIGGGIYLLNISIDDTEGNVNFTMYGLTVDAIGSTCLIASNSPVSGTEKVNVSGSCTNPEGDVKLYRNGVDVTGELGIETTVDSGTYTYILNVTSTQNYTSATATTTVVVSGVTGVEAVCRDSDVSFLDASALAGLILVIMLVGTVLAVLIMGVTGFIDLNKFTSDVVSLEKLPAIIIVIGLLYLVIATMSFLIASNVCIAFGA